MPEKKIIPERPVIIALLILILLGGIAVVIYGMLGGQIGQPPQPEGSGASGMLGWQAIQHAAWMIESLL